MPRALAAALAILLLAGCGEPEPQVSLPARDAGAHVADLAEVLSAGDREKLDQRLEEISQDGLEMVALTFESDNANCGEAYRAAKEFVTAWEADVALVAVAAPGDFTSSAQSRNRCLGVQPLEDRAVPGSVREYIAEQLVPPLTADNDWYGAFVAAAEVLAEQ